MAKDKAKTETQTLGGVTAVGVPADLLARVKDVLYKAADPQLHNAALVETSSQHPLGLRVLTKDLADAAGKLIPEVESLLGGTG